MHEHHKLELTKGVPVVITALALVWAAATHSDAGTSHTGAEAPVEFSAAEVSRILQQSPLPAVPRDPTNAVDSLEAAAHLGQFLFSIANFLLMAPSRAQLATGLI